MISFVDTFIILVLPSLNGILNDSLRKGFFPTVIKMAIVTTLVLKSKQLNSDVLNNYRPVSNLTTLLTVFENAP